MNQVTQYRAARLATAAFALVGAIAHARADVVTDWNIKANEVVVESKLGTPPAIRVMALVQTAVNDAVRSATPQPGTQPASVEAAVAAANRAVLVKLLPNQQAMIDAAYQAAVTSIPEGADKAAGIAAGERAAAAVLAKRTGDVIAPESYRPHTTPGAYVPTAAAAAPQWSQRTPWLMSSAAQFRAGPPPALSSDAWARDYNEVRELGSRTSTKRTVEQTEVARFWEYSLPAIYFGAIRSVATQPDRDVARNARLLAASAQAMDDAMIAVFDAKYAYNFWRPATAIRNGDIDGNDSTTREPTWAPLIEAPMHPEYPSAHATLAAAVGTVLKVEIGSGAKPVIATSSPTAKGATHRWGNVDDFIREVAESRIYAGIHYRGSTEAGTAMGKQIGALVADRVLQPAIDPARSAAGTRIEPVTVLMCEARGAAFFSCQP
jgi:VCPO second helical-bundle domain